MNHPKENSKKNIVICCLLNQKGSPSWLKTTQHIIQEVKKHHNVVDVIDYSIQNPILKKLHKLYAFLFFGHQTHRDGFDNFFMERKFKKQVKKIKEPTDVFLHISNIVVPRSMQSTAEHIAYIDASLFGSIQIKNTKYHPRFLKKHVAITNTYATRLKSLNTFNAWTKDSMINDYHIEASKVINTGFGANLNPYYNDKDYSNKLILTVLRRGLEEQKGLYLLLKAFKLARKTDANIKLAVVGTTLESQEGVEYYEGYPREKTIELFTKASLFAMPALFEPNGMVYIEALACKTPLLGLNRLAFPEFAGYGKYGFIVNDNKEDIANNILKACSNPERLKDMGIQGQKFAVERFSWNNVIKRLIK